MITRDIVVVGASAGGIEALQILVRGLPKSFHASVFVVLHTAASSPNTLHKILERAGPLPASTAAHWESIKPGHIYVAPADHHLLLERSGYLRVTRGPKENRFRPAIDALFRSAAHAFGRRVVGVILTGFLDDGTAGLWSIKERGGIAVVQHPEDAVAPSMPLSALRYVEVDRCLPLNEIPPLLVQLTSAPVEEKGGKPMSEELETEVKIAREDNARESGIMNWGHPSIFACPECHGVLLQLKEGSNLRFRCHTGHAYSIETLLAEFGEKTETVLWNVVRSLDETVLLLRRMAEQLDQHEHKPAADALREKALRAQAQADVVRNAVLQQAQPKDPSA